MSEVWFVGHRFDLRDVSDRIIGFWDKRANYDRISVNDIIIYYRAGERKIIPHQPGEIRGIFKVIKKDEDLCTSFSNKFVEIQLGKKKFLKWQCELELEKEIKMPKKEMDKLKTQLSFYHNWKVHCYGGGGKQVFPATQDDIDLTFRKAQK